MQLILFFFPFSKKLRFLQRVFSNSSLLWLKMILIKIMIPANTTKSHILLETLLFLEHVIFHTQTLPLFCWCAYLFQNSKAGVPTVVSSIFCRYSHFFFRWSHPIFIVNDTKMCMFNEWPSSRSPSSYIQYSPWHSHMHISKKPQCYHEQSRVLHTLNPSLLITCSSLSKW